MTTEERDLLLRDLSARLPYGVKCRYDHTDCIGTLDVISDNTMSLSDGPVCYTRSIGYIKPYLFPLSSMTNEQIKEFNNLTTSIEVDSFKIGSCIDCDFDECTYNCFYVSLEDMLTCIDWLNSHHFDYRGLIEKGLAIDATGLNIY